MNNRQKMRLANKAAREYLRSLGYQHICIFPHGYSYEQIVNGKIQKQTDLFGLFDGITIKKVPGYKPLIVFLQIKTNNLPSLSRYNEFVSDNDVNIYILVYDSRTKKIRECRALFLPKSDKTRRVKNRNI